ncbi:MAG: CHASE2 domain-containing protein, partial [Acidobacteriales bacterium]
PVSPDGSTVIPRVSIRELLEHPEKAELFRGKAVFIGVTAQSAARDRLMTPYGSARPMPGVEIHANAFETLMQGRFVKMVGNLEVLEICAAFAVLAGLIFGFLSGWAAYSLAGVLLAAAHVLPYAFFTRDLVLPPTAPVAAAWLAMAGAATYQHFVARRQLRRAESEKARYQEAVHFVTHEMRTPLTAIQGSSELLTRYKLTADKRDQIAGLIQSESRRLARMIETFLNVERLSAGQMELKQEPLAAAGVLRDCMERVNPLAERKQIRLRSGTLDDVTLMGDRELLEYAFYNLMTNAVKYSPAQTEVAIEGLREGECFRLSVRDQGIGMDKKELQNVFRKFYRTRRAVASGEAGTGIGLSIVEQIVTQHGGKIEVESEPGKGSCFTVVLPALAAAAVDGR